nr:helix-turn-helix domain-containing protein [Globicatella sanguinis]
MLSIIDRWYKLLNYLLLNDTVSINDLENYLQNSQQTIKNSINQLNSEMSQIAHITEKNNYFRIEILNYSEFERIMGGSIKLQTDFNSSDKRQAYIIKRLLEEEKYIITLDLSEELGVSRGTFSNDLKTIKKLTNDYGVQIISVPNKGIKLEGEELNLRLFGIYHCIDFFEFKNINQEHIDMILGLQNKYSFRKQDAHFLLKVLELTICRIRNNQHLTKPIPKYVNYIKNSQLYNEIILYIETEFTITLNEYEKDFITFPLCINGNSINISISQLMENDYLLESFQLIMGTIKNYFMIEIDEDNFFNDLSKHLAFLNNRLIFNYQIEDIFHGEIEKKYPFSYRLAKDTLKVLKTYFNSHISDVEANFLTFYYELDSKTKDEEKVKKEIAIICNTGKATAGMIRRQIEKVVGQNIKIVQFSESNYENEDLSKYFAIITTIPLKNIPQEIPTIRLTNIFKDDYLALEWGKLKVDRNNLGDKTLVFLNRYSSSTYEEVITKMVSELREEKLIDYDFKERLFNRKAPVLNNNGIIFPHELNYTSKKIIIKIGVLENTVILDNESVELILLVAIPNNIQNDDNDLLDLYDFIFGIGQNPQLKERIIRMDSVEEFNRYFSKGMMK